MKYLRSQEMNQLLKELLKLSALPIKQMSPETFSVDSTGFSTSIFADGSITNGEKKQPNENGLNAMQ